MELSSGSSMHTTSQHPAPRERRQSTGKPHPRFAAPRGRAALHAVICDPDVPSGQRTPAPEHPWHDLTRTNPRTALPTEKEDEMLEAAITQGCTTRDKVITYFLTRIGTAMAHFPDADDFRLSDILYVRAMAEIAEAQESFALAHTLPTTASRAAAVREGREAHAMMELLCSTYERGETVPFSGAR